MHKYILVRVCFVISTNIYVDYASKFCFACLCCFFCFFLSSLVFIQMGTAKAKASVTLFLFVGIVAIHACQLVCVTFVAHIVLVVDVFVCVCV